MKTCIAQPNQETPLRRVRIALVQALSRILRVPVKISDEFYGAESGSINSEVA